MKDISGLPLYLRKVGLQASKVERYLLDYYKVKEYIVLAERVTCKYGNLLYLNGRFNLNASQSCIVLTFTS